MAETERQAELREAIDLLRLVRTAEDERLWPGLDRAIRALDERLQLSVPLLPPSAPSPPRPPAPPVGPRLAGRITADQHDLRCPHCSVVVLKRERIRLDAERGGAPEFCPRCGERTGEEPPPIAGP